jgi:hypothetical protein
MTFGTPQGICLRAFSFAHLARPIPPYSCGIFGYSPAWACIPAAQTPNLLFKFLQVSKGWRQFNRSESRPGVGYCDRRARIRKENHLHTIGEYKANVKQLLRLPTPSRTKSISKRFTTHGGPRLNGPFMATVLLGRFRCDVRSPTLSGGVFRLFPASGTARRSFPRSPPSGPTSRSSTTWASCAGTGPHPPSPRSRLDWTPRLPKTGGPGPVSHDRRWFSS